MKNEDALFEKLELPQRGFQAKRRMAAGKLQEPWNEDEWRRNNWRCQHGWLRGEQCEICNAPQPAQEPPSEWEGIKAILDEYGLQAIDFVADFKAAVAQPAQEPEREALKLALEALESDHPDIQLRAQITLRAVLAQPAQPEQEPVAVISAWSLREVYFDEDGEPSMHRSPPQREWVGLTDEEIDALWQEWKDAVCLDHKTWAKAIEAALKDKNNGT